MQYRVFIQSNDQQNLGAKVAEYAIKKMSRYADRFSIEVMRLKDNPVLFNRHGQKYLRDGKERVWNNNDLQSFTPLRFLPPQLMNFEGRAIVIDPDVFALCDIFDLFSMDMQGKAIACRKIVPSDNRKSYFATSVMLLDCAQLKHWKWDQSIDDMFSFKRDYRKWMSLELELDSTVLTLDDNWNDYDHLTQSTKLLHNTGRLTQPWKTGLPIDFTAEKDGIKAAPKSKWGIPIKWVRFARSIANGEKYIPDGYYLRHPDRKQEQFFFSLLKQCLDDNFVSKDQIEEDIRKKYIRPDAFEMIKSVSEQ